MIVEQRRQREFVNVPSLDEILSILKSQFSTRHLYVKHPPDKTEVVVQEFLDDDSLLLKTTNGPFPDSPSVTIYGLLDKYIEVDLSIVKRQDDQHYYCKIAGARKAAAGRRHLRFKIAPGEAYGTNFKVSRHTISLSSFSIPTSIKVILDQYHSTHAHDCDIVRVDVFKADDNAVLQRMKKTGASFFVPDVANPEEYCAVDEGFVDGVDLYGGMLGTVIKKNVERGYRSIAAVPIIYDDGSDRPIPFGYIEMITTGAPIGLDRVRELQEDAARLVERIRDANTTTVGARQEIVDISRGGARLKITDPALKELLAKSGRFVFDLVFKLQAPITIYGEIRSTMTDSEGTNFIGVDFEGNSSRKNEIKRFISYLAPLEAAYKSRLAKSVLQTTM